MEEINLNTTVAECNKLRAQRKIVTMGYKLNEQGDTVEIWCSIRRKDEKAANPKSVDYLKRIFNVKPQHKGNYHLLTHYQIALIIDTVKLFPTVQFVVRIY